MLRVELISNQFRVSVSREIKSRKHFFLYVTPPRAGVLKGKVIPGIHLLQNMYFCGIGNHDLREFGRPFSSMRPVSIGLRSILGSFLVKSENQESQNQIKSISTCENNVPDSEKLTRRLALSIVHDFCCFCEQRR